jgi:putative FmdB family regulatory protein
MPLYEYQCDACGFRFEVIQRFSDAPLESCQSCSGPVRKLLSPPAIQFKGSGWYITDYARKGMTGGSSSSDSKDAKAADSASPDKTEPAAKSAAHSSSD